MKYKCKICGYIYDETQEKVKFDELPQDWTCSDCTVPKSYFSLVEDEKVVKQKTAKTDNDEPVYVLVNDDCHSIARDESKCIRCGNCKETCKKQGVCGYFDPKKIKNKAICIDCGQCTLACPTGAINYKGEIEEVKKALTDKDKIVVFQTAPSVRVAVAEEFGAPRGKICEGKIVSALRKLGAKYVFDTTFGADLTIMEEASELVKRIKEKGTLPQFTSCCPAWVKFAEIFEPNLIQNLSTAKSPILMQGPMIKTYFAKIMKIDPCKIVSVAITPCTAKKAEIRREEFNASAKYNKGLCDIDNVLTVRELAKWLKAENIDFNTLENSNYDDIFGRGSGAGVIFGNSGGVMEAALRTAHYLLTGKNLDKVELTAVRGVSGVREANVKIGEQTLHVAVVAGTGNLRTFLAGDISKYDFIEVMACPGGCISGGGQPKAGAAELEEVLSQRNKGLYQLDKISKTRKCHENPDIIKIYKEFLGKPLSELSRQILHTSYTNKNGLLG